MIAIVTSGDLASWTIDKTIATANLEIVDTGGQKGREKQDLEDSLKNYKKNQ